MATSIKQALNRLNSGHERVLRARAADELVDTTQSPASSILGLRKCASTLEGWGALDHGKITQFGRDLLAALDDRRAERIGTAA